MCLRIFTLNCKHEGSHLSVRSSLSFSMRCLPCRLSHALGDTTGERDKDAGLKELVVCREVDKYAERRQTERCAQMLLVAAQGSLASPVAAGVGC